MVMKGYGTIDQTGLDVQLNQMSFFFFFRFFFSKSSKHKNTHMNIIFKYTMALSNMNPGNWFIMICIVYPDLSVPILRILKKSSIAGISSLYPRINKVSTTQILDNFTPGG